MKTLILLRHAKSAWDDPALADHDRPLARRGRLAAPLMGAWLAEMKLRPDLAVLSSSVRTRETWARVIPTLPNAPEPRIEPALYEAEPDAIAAVIAALPPSADTALLLGHNPGFEDYAGALAGQSLRMPTAAAAVFTLDGDWSEIDAAELRLTAFETPKSLV